MKLSVTEEAKKQLQDQLKENENPYIRVRVKGYG